MEEEITIVPESKISTFNHKLNGGIILLLGMGRLCNALVNESQISENATVVIAIMSTVIGILLSAGGIGVFLKKNWGRLLSIAGFIGAICTSLVIMIMGGITTAVVFMVLITAVAFGGLARFLYQSKEAFE